MTAVVLVSCLLAAPPAQPVAEPHTARPVEQVATAAASPPDDAASARRRQVGAIRDRTRVLLRQEATTDGEPHRAVVRELVAWYGELLRDEVLPDRSRQALARLVRARLVRIADRIRRDQARRQRHTDRSRHDREAMMQRKGAAPAADAVPRVGQMNGVIAWSAAAAGVPSVAGVFAQMGAGGLGLGGPPLPGGPTAAGGPGGEDYGDELVDLIQAVISPPIWGVNGGPGAVHYYRPLRVLVIRAPGEIHAQVGGALDDLRGRGN